MGGVFISCSWKDAISYEVAMLLREWLPSVIQTVKPFLSTVDIDAGSQWAAEMFQALKDAQVGIICVTRKNQVTIVGITSKLDYLKGLGSPPYGWGQF